MVVATWNPAAAAGYYTRQTGYYTQGGEPAGIWYAPSRDFGLVDGATVDTALFERLFVGTDENGASLLPDSGNRLDRTPAFDITLSAPRSVALAWALGDAEVSASIETAQATAVRHTLDMLQREAIRARRGRGGSRIEAVPLTAAIFRHGESRPATHEDGKVFGDPNLHSHCVVLNLARRADGSVGALHSKILRDWKMAAGAVYHAALAAELQAAGFAIDRVGRNGVFEIAGIDDRAIRYFSARRREIETELAEGGSAAVDAAQAATVARATRRAKPAPGSEARETVWRSAARRIGLDITPVVERTRSSAHNRSAIPDLLTPRLADLPDAMTQTKSVVDRRELVRCVAEALVGTGRGADHVTPAVGDLIRGGAVVEIGRDAIGQPRYSSAAMIRIERELMETAGRLAAREGITPDPGTVLALCESRGLSSEQTEAALAATAGAALAIVEGAPGTGKTTLLAPIVEAWRDEGYRVIGAATAWRVAHALRDDLGIESRATASWMAQEEAGRPFLDHNTVLIVDEAGLLSSREMHAVLDAADRAGAKVLLVGDRDQLQPIGAGSGLAIAARATEATRVATIVRQREPWAREAITAFGRGDAEAALASYAAHGQLVETDGALAAVKAAVDRVAPGLIRPDAGSALILARTNNEVAMIGREVRERLREQNLIGDEEVTVDASTPSGHHCELSIAAGERVRFLARLDAIGVVNGSIATVTCVIPGGTDANGTRHARIEALVGDRPIAFDTRELADRRGRIRLGWAYASTLYGAQGTTVDNAAVLVTPAFDRHDIYVAASRARETTTLVMDRRAIDRLIDGEQDDGSLLSPTATDEAERRARLAALLSQARVKQTTIDMIVPSTITAAPAYDRHRAQRGGTTSPKNAHVREVGHEL